MREKGTLIGYIIDFVVPVVRACVCAHVCVCARVCLCVAACSCGCVFAPEWWRVEPADEIFSRVHRPQSAAHSCLHISQKAHDNADRHTDTHRQTERATQTRTITKTTETNLFCESRLVFTHSDPVETLSPATFMRWNVCFYCLLTQRADQPITRQQPHSGIQA